MRRSLGKLSHPAIGQTSRKALLLSSPFDFSTQAGNSGGGGGGRGRGRGSDFSKFSFVSSGPGKSGETNPDDETSFRAPLGHGRGKPLPSPPNVHQFTSSEPPSGGRGTVSGRGRGAGTAPPPHQFEENLKPRTPIFFHKEGEVVSPPKAPIQDQSGNQENSALPSSIISVLSGAGRGRPTSAPTNEASNEKVKEVNRHIKPRQTVGPETRPVEPRPPSPKLSREEAVNKARSVLSRNDDGVRGGPREGSRMAERSDGGGRGLRGRGGDRGRGRGRGRGMGRGGRMPNRDEDDDEDDEDEEETELDKANEEKLKKYLGPEKMAALIEAFEEAGTNVLPSPTEDAFVDAMHTNMMLECEPEYLMAEFDSNPDIDEKPAIPLRDALQKMKPFLMAYENIETEKEWQECLEETMKQVPLMKELVDAYSGPNRPTAKKQGEELERVANTLPASAPQSVKRFTDRAVLSLKSNPGWGFNRKCQFMDKLVWEAQQSYK